MKKETSHPHKKKAALFDPYLDIMGGGERHILSILQVLEQSGYEVSIFWDKDLSETISKKLNLTFNNLKTVPNIFARANAWEKLQALRDIDLLLYVTDGSYFFSSAGKTVIFSMVPNRNLYDMGLLNRLKTTGSRFIANSSFTATWLAKWGISSRVVYPYVSNDFIARQNTASKDNIILSVGRFFPHLHAKRHGQLIEAFKQFKKSHKDFRLVLAGGIKEEDRGYLEELNTIIDGDKAVTVTPNIPYSELLKLYGNAKFFWHFAGYGVDEDQNPHQVEHLGMTPLEAMASGAVPFCYRAGGPKEIIREGKTGFLFLTVGELIRKTEALLDDKKLYSSMQKQGASYINEYFSFDVFKKNVKNILL